MRPVERTKTARAASIHLAFAISLPTLLGLGCSTETPKSEGAELGKPISVNLRERVIVEESTIDDVEHLLGPPQRKVTHSDGREQWVYAWGRVAGTEIRVETLSVVFEAGVVSRIDFTGPEPAAD